MALNSSIHIRIPTTLKRELEDIADHRDTTSGRIVRLALIDYMKQSRQATDLKAIAKTIAKESQ